MLAAGASRRYAASTHGKTADRPVPWAVPMKKTLYLVLPLLAVALAVGFAIRSRFHREPVLGTGEAAALSILHPLDQTLFPRDLAPPIFRWREAQAGVDAWRVTWQFQDRSADLSFHVTVPEWRPTTNDWERIKAASLEKPAQVTVLGFRQAQPQFIRSRGRVTVTTSKDEVGACLFYREVNLPFEEAVKDPTKIRWRFGSLSSPQPPPVVLEHLPVCGNCHSFSKDGAVLGMDVDYANSKASYIITRTAEQMALLPRDIMTWNDYRREDGEQTFGLLSQVSPDGQWVVSTVKDRSVFVPRPDLAYSQLFFPIKGILVAYHRGERAFRAVAGADDPAYVQSNPVWSPDGRYLVFARAKAYALRRGVSEGKVLLSPEDCQEFLKEGKLFQFDLYRLPFNDGAGGRPEPLEGASQDGLSHYFPRYSPDGKWIVFCTARSYMLLQADSELYIIPAAGGKARRLRASHAGRMNSWHSWSPNSRWLVFASKAHSPYTQLFLTHIDEQGESSPAVWLEHLTAPDRAANIPEFVNLSPQAIQNIQEQYLNDYSYERAGNEFYKAGDTDRALEKYRQALAANPANVTAHQKLGFLLFNVKKHYREGLAHTTEALRLDPRNAFAHSDLGMALLVQGQVVQAIVHLAEALKHLPATYETQYQPKALRFNLGEALLKNGRLPESAAQLREVVRLDPGHAEAHYMLALALICQGQLDEALAQHAAALKLKPAIDTSATLHDQFAAHYAAAGRYAEAIRAEEKALRLARAAGQEDLGRAMGERLEQLRALAGESRVPTANGRK